MSNLGPALMNDDVWVALFGLGTSQFAGISVSLNESTLVVNPLDTDQLASAISGQSKLTTSNVAGCCPEG